MSFLRFVALAIRRTPIGAFLSAIANLGGSGGMAGLQSLMEAPPWPLAEWWLPLALTVAGTIGFAWVFYRQVEWTNRSGPWANMAVCEAIEYIVNYSDAKIPYSVEVGFEHEWAKNALLARARAGDLTVWGRRLPTLNATTFEGSLSKIETGFWQECEFAYAVYAATASSKQTQVRGAMNKPHLRFSDLHVNKEQVRSIWSPSFAKWMSKVVLRRPVVRYP